MGRGYDLREGFPRDGVDLLPRETYLLCTHIIIVIIVVVVVIISAASRVTSIQHRPRKVFEVGDRTPSLLPSALLLAAKSPPPALLEATSS